MAVWPIDCIGFNPCTDPPRRVAGVPPFVPMPCDNLASNGAKLHAALAAFAHRLDPALGDWVAGEVRVPSTMVDSITPASDDALYAAKNAGRDCVREAEPPAVVLDVVRQAN